MFSVPFLYLNVETKKGFILKESKVFSLTGSPVLGGCNKCL